MQLADKQKQSFIRHGFVRLRGVIPPTLVERAKRAINHSLGKGMKAKDMKRIAAQSYCKELQTEPVILDLFHQSPMWSLAESCLGVGKVKKAHSGQIALRFPSLDDEVRPPWPHLDGMHSKHNGVPKGVIHNFTALLGIALSDVPRPFSGNLSVWPGTHHMYESYFREHGPQSLFKGMPKVRLPKPKQMRAKAGDAFLVHYQVAHSGTINLSPNVRYAIYFRLKHIDHDKDPWGAMTNIWRDWEGLREVIPQP